MIIDAHCHLQDIKLNHMPRDIICVITGYSVNSNIKALQLAKTYKMPYALGFAPQEVIKLNKTMLDHNLNIFFKQIDKHKPVIGEVGLDYHWAKKEEKKENEIQVFKKILEKAEKLKLNVVIHSRKSEEDIINILSTYNIKNIMFHFWNGKIKHAKMAVNKLNNVFFSIIGLPSKDRAKVIKYCGLTCLLAETDAPYVFKSPLEVKKSIGYIADKLSLSFEEVAEATAKNAKYFFNIK